MTEATPTAHRTPRPARISQRLARHRPTYRTLLAAAACLAMIASAVAFRPTGLAEFHFHLSPGAPFQTPDSSGYLYVALALLLVGLILLAAALRLAPRQAIWTPAAPSLPPLRRRAYPVLALGIAALFALAESNGHGLGLTVLYDRSPGVQIALLVAGIVLLAWGAAGAPLPAAQAPRVPWPEVALVAALTLIALYLRVWHLNLTIRIFVDELNFAAAMERFRDGEQIDVLFPISLNIAFPQLYSVFQWESVEILGRTFAGLRMPSAILGTLTVPALYLLGRALFDRATGLIAAALLVAFPPHLQFSRLALNNIADPLFGTLALAFLARGLRGGKRADFALAGVCLGLTQYFYEGGRLTYPALTVGWMVALALLRHRLPWRGLLLAALVAGIVAAPVYYTLAGRDLPLTARLDRTADDALYWKDVPPNSAPVHGVRDYAERLKDRFLAYVTLYEDGTLYYGGRTPLLLIVLAPAFLLGAGWCLARPRAPGSSLLLAGLVLVPLGNSLLAGPFSTARYVVVFPALALASALGLRTALALLWPGDRWPRVRQVAVIVGVGIVVVFQARYYFGPHLDTFNYQARAVHNVADGTDAVLRSRGFPPGTQIHFISTPAFDGYYANAALGYFTDGLGIEPLTPANITTRYLDGLRHDVDHAFFVDIGALDVVDRLKTRFVLSSPGLTSEPNIPIDKQYVLYYAPAMVRP